MAGITILVAGKPAVFVSGNNLGQFGRGGHPEIASDTVDITTFNDSAHRNRQGLEQTSFSWTGLFDSTANASYPIVKDLFGDSTGAATARVASYYPEGTAAGAPIGYAKPGVGLSSARAFGLTESGGVGDVLELNGEISQDGTADFLDLIVGTTITANYTSTNIDLGGASSTAGGRFYFHSLRSTAAGGNAKWTFVVEHASATNAAYVIATGATATFGSGSATGVVLTSSGQLRRFVRLTGTRDNSAGTIEFVVGAKRV
jgi:hypothetical protein